MSLPNESPDESIDPVFQATDVASLQDALAAAEIRALESRDLYMRALAEMENMRKYVKAGLALGIVALLAGGIGIMNVTLATIFARVREIGIRRAIGARQGDIVRQFLTEAVMISIVGGLIGIAFGFTLSRLIASAAGWSTVVTTSSIVIAFGVSVFIGLLFGIYPAVQAARLDPIEAIRYE